ncbi:hypothetical protein RND71_028267 [Anisodus tanguticus]|uniref:MADS-box domain-containing protein n=1 Tax=Anisodus tanguticus TaxID=243964 RepID=A0AAE1V1F2_9SOLA|nr:hypothetical protein RND71_028266 [Anisodus tanguticus]KAK4352749.1 hypothetical protein RND71_028267 [Anisodus tanguticus]
MGRSKINKELIQDHKNRKSTFLKRKAGLIKKISELSILCDIKACMIIYEGNNNQVTISQHDEIWPNDPNQVQELINLYKNQPLEGQSKRDKNLSSFFENQKKNEEIKAERYPTWDSRFDHLSIEELRNLTGVLERKMENAKEKAEFLKGTNNVQDSIGSSLSLDQEIWDYPELMNNNSINQNTPWPISYVNPFIDMIPSGMNSMGAGMDTGLLPIDDYQFRNKDSMKIEAENWLANNGIGSSSTMQPMEYPFMYNGSTHMPYGFQ